MIYTVTINPALDYHMNVPSPAFGKINRSTSEAVFPGGKGLNVSVVLSRLGIPNIATGFIGGSVGDAILHAAEFLGVQCDFVSVAGESRINVKLRSNVETAFNGAGPDLTYHDLDLLLEKLSHVGADDYVVLSGNVPTSIANSYTIILEHLSHTGCRVIVDAAGDTLWNSLSYRPYLISPNLEELGGLLDFPKPTFDEAVSIAGHLQREGAQNIMVSMGAAGAFLLTEKNHLFSGHVTTGQIVSTVGAGDSLVAGYLAGLLAHGHKADALAMGLAAGTAAVFTSHLPQKREILSFLPKVQITEAQG